MAKTEGFVQLVCDRCNTSTYTTDNSPIDQSWKQVRRIAADGGEVTRTLCPSCTKDYRELATNQDAEFSVFMEGNHDDAK